MHGIRSRFLITKESVNVIRPIILCGGGGTRLWPLSSPRLPKQFLNLVGSQSMLTETAARVGDATRFRRPLAIGSTRHAGLLRESLPNADLLLEPVARNSAPPVIAACLLSDADELLLVLPSDQHIADISAFTAAIEKGSLFAADGRIVTFGIEPDHPATGYGYIEAEGGGDVRPVSRFVEKPDFETAVAYLETGRFFWNAGIFLFKAGTMVEAFKKYAPDIFEDTQAALNGGKLDRDAFSKVRSESIDYAVMERARNVSVLPVSMGWSDLGDFRSLMKAGAVSSSDKVVKYGPVATTNTTNAYVRSESPRVAVHGLNDLAVVATRDSVLVTRLSDAEGIKGVINELSIAGHASVSEEHRSWLRGWLWSHIMPAWARLAVDPSSGVLIEGLDLGGQPMLFADCRGRVAPRQLFSFARAKRLGWNPGNLADNVIESALAFLADKARSPKGGWAHAFNADGSIANGARDLYDHAFIALAGSELVALGERRGFALAEEAFEIIDTLFADPQYDGWYDPEIAPGEKLANPHMHLLEASLAYYEAVYDTASLRRIEKITTLFERWMFDPETGAMSEQFDADWLRKAGSRIEPGHCYEWAFLLHEAERLTGRDTASWQRRLVDYAETHGLRSGLAVDTLGAEPVSFRLWPQLERLRALTHVPRPGADVAEILGQIIAYYLRPGPDHCWVDKLNVELEPDVSAVPASMVYHLMTALAPIAPPR
ncbi:AGE family epimerase/isomerase [Hyphobacterium sp. HN65]|uniref:AGE family epimerase/isomerase n=1 Tax=Hyphobacterium lacteum TaxID=3116575 RepID=A0ABU7LPM1_9PROT|nr:AGE family epimerase/isomerase [Hyphobacterium sp. HN65]MEE2525858.1 AGE family epimerase/isomerase [Hyphobacterium sp. HN65]